MFRIVLGAIAIVLASSLARESNELAILFGLVLASAFLIVGTWWFFEKIFPHFLFICHKVRIYITNPIDDYLYNLNSFGYKQMLKHIFGVHLWVNRGQTCLICSKKRILSKEEQNKYPDSKQLSFHQCLTKDLSNYNIKHSYKCHEKNNLKN